MQTVLDERSLECKDHICKSITIMDPAKYHTNRDAEKSPFDDERKSDRWMVKQLHRAFQPVIPL